MNSGHDGNRDSYLAPHLAMFSRQHAHIWRSQVLFFRLAAPKTLDTGLHRTIIPAGSTQLAGRAWPALFA